MTVKELSEQITIQGAFQIKRWDNNTDDYIMLSEGSSFEDEVCEIENEILNVKIKYMYTTPTASGMGSYIVFDVE